MNLFSKLLILLLVNFVASSAFAIELMGVYTSTCKRKLGTILHVENRQIDFLELNGKVTKLKPHQIIYLAYYPMDQLPIRGKVDISSVDRIQIKTEVNDQVVNLVSGWPIGFTPEKIAFLTTKGQETIVSRESIFSLEKKKNTKDFQFTSVNRNIDNLEFVHPYVFRNCKLKNSSRKSKIYPQQVLSNTIMIKKQLDNLEEGHKKISRYIREQKFYSKPLVYKNRTSLGMWYSLGSRYGESTKRPSNMTPVLTDTYASDVFDYQHTFVTGSAPMLYSIHGESQTQMYYAFKASYFHFQAFADPNLILVGKRYKWQEGDFDRPDDKINPTAMLEMGLDFGNWEFQFYLSDVWQLGLYDGNNYFEENYSVPRLGVVYNGLKYRFELSAGSLSETDSFSGESFSAGIFRFNLSADHSDSLSWAYSLIGRSFELNKNSSSIDYSSNSIENYFYGYYQWKKKYTFGLYLGLEQHNNQYTSSQSRESNYFKSGVSASISF